MKDLTDSLPSGPLPRRVAEQLGRRDGRFVPVTAHVESDETVVDTILVEGREQLRGVGYDRDEDTWTILAVFPEQGTLEGIPEPERDRGRQAIQLELTEWANARYESTELLVDR